MFNEPNWVKFGPPDEPEDVPCTHDDVDHWIGEEDEAPMVTCLTCGVVFTLYNWETGNDTN